jgi:hypothetical protein
MNKQEISNVEPLSLPRNLDDLLIFDARFLDARTRRQLLRIFPRLLHIRRLWKKEYLESGCLSCQKPDQTIRIAARLRSRGSTWAEIYEVITPNVASREERKRFENAVRWKLQHLDAPTREPSQWYGAGGLCNACQVRIFNRMHRRYHEIGADRQVAKETADLTRKSDAAQMLLNGDE